VTEPHTHTRRQFVRGAVQLGIGAAALATLAPRAASAAPVKAGVPGPVQVLLADLRETTAADFARGQARGVTPVAPGGRAGLRGSAGGAFTSGTLALPFPATHAGLHWVVEGTDAETVAVELRTSADDRTWSPWQPLQIEAVAEAATDREVFAALAGAAGARFAQYRATFQSAEPTTLTAMTVTAINSVDGPQATAATAARTTASFATPDGPGRQKSFTVITREGWGCDEALRFSGTSERWPEMYVPVKKVVLHHTATGNTYTNGAAEVRAIYAYHAKTLGWGDIGYNSLIDKYGNIYEGRHGRGETADTREILSADVVAGHVYGHNYGSTGVAALGNFDPPRPRAKAVEPTVEMKTAIADVVTFECGRQGIDPDAPSDFLKSDGTWHTGLQGCSGHSDSYSTECPGTTLKAYLPTLRTTVAARLSRLSAPTLSGPDQVQPLTASDTLTLTFTWPEGTVASFCLEGWSKRADSEDITYLRGYAAPLSGEPDYGEPLVNRQSWTANTSNPSGISFTGLSAGHYTMHVRGPNRYEANRTYLVK